MDERGWHLTFDLRGRGPIARNAEEWDRMIRVLAAVLQAWNVLAFCMVHDHLHVLVAGDRERAGRAAHAVECALGAIRRGADTGRRELWNEPRFTVLRDRRHLIDATPHVLNNGATATGTDPLAWRWSSAWGVLGLLLHPGQLGRGFEVTAPGFVADAVCGDHAWRPPLARKLASPADSPAVLWRVTIASLGFASGGASMDRAERTLARRIFAGLATHRGWSVAAAAASVGIPDRTMRRLASAPPTADELAPALRLLGLVEAGYPIDELLPKLPPDPLPREARRRVRPGRR
jgi:hypothetical protein